MPLLRDLNRTEGHIPLLVLCLLALTVACVVGYAAAKFPRIADPGPAAARKADEAIRTSPALRVALTARLDPQTATGLALLLALLLIIGGGVLFGVLTYLVGSNAHLFGIDRSVARWANVHASAFSTHGLNAITFLGQIYVVVGLGIVLAVVETIAERTARVVPFIVAVILGEETLVLSVKELVGRARPTFNTVASTLGPSFPSGHSATAAAFYAAAALLLGRRRTRPVQALLFGLAAGIAVAVAASRVLLDVHWLTDVIAGLTLGWAWFAVCAVAFGGRILRFGATAEAAARNARAR